MRWPWRIVEEQCVGCGICADVCEYAAITLTRPMRSPEVVPGNCESGCGVCALQCPVGAIVVREPAAAHAGCD